MVSTYLQAAPDGARVEESGCGDQPLDAPQPGPRLSPGAAVRGRPCPTPWRSRRRHLGPLFRKNFSLEESPNVTAEVRSGSAR